MTHQDPPLETTKAADTLAAKRDWIGLAVLALPALLASLELTVTNLALPSIGKDLHASSTQLLWTVDIYAFLLAGSLITMGAWGDRIGRRRVLLIGAAGFGVASLLAAFAVNIEMLIGARALMGIAGSTLMPSTLSLASALFINPKQRAVAISIIIASVSAGTAIGPLVGGWLLDHFWWGSAFLLAVPVMALLLILVPALVPEHRGTATGPLDLLSALLSVAAILPVVYGIKQIATDGVTAYAVIALIVGIGLAGAFAARQFKLDEPFVDLRLFRDRIFATAGTTLALGIFVLWGSNYAIAQYLQLVKGLSPLTAGLWTAPAAIGVIVGSTIAPRLAEQFSASRVISAGLLVSAAGYALLTQIGGERDLAVLVSGAVVVAAGLGPTMALATDLMIGAAPPRRAGSAAAIASATPQLGGAFGIAVLGSIITAAYRIKVSGAAPTGVTTDAADSLREDLNAASAAAQSMAQPLATQYLDAAREAFTVGFQVAAIVSVAIMLAASAVILLAGRTRSATTT